MSIGASWTPSARRGGGLPAACVCFAAMGHAAIPVAVVGAGNMGRHHARNYYEMPEADLRAIVDVDSRSRDALAERFACRPLGTVKELVAEIPEVEAVSVAVPTSLHREVAGSLLESGKHVLVEKPIAATLAEATELVDLAESRSLTLAVGHIERFNPALGELRRLMDGGSLGRPLSLLARRVGVMPPQIKDANVILDLAIHDLDVFRFLLDAELPEEIYCNAGKAIAQDRYDFADIFVRFGEVGCYLQTNWLTPVKIRSLTLTGTEAYAELEYVTQELRLHAGRAFDPVSSFSDIEAYSEHAPVQIRVEKEEPLRREIREFIEASAGRVSTVVTGRDGLTSLAVALSAVDAAAR